MGFLDNPFGGLFDFNRDGKESLSELWIAQRMFEECAKEQEKISESNYGSDFPDDDDGYEWRMFCEDGLEYGVIPEDYETEYEYIEALNEAKYGWRDICEDGSEYGIDAEDYETEDEYEEALNQAREDAAETKIMLNVSLECPALDAGLEKLQKIKEEDYPNKRRYNAAYTLANDFIFYGSDESKKREKDRCKFIVDNADKILAANYLSNDFGFLYAQAIKDNFPLPCSLPDEDETREMSFSEVLVKISKRDVPLSFKIWEWCLDQFLPYAEYDGLCENTLSAYIIDNLYSFPDGYKTQLIHYMTDNPEFCKRVLTAGDEAANNMSDLIAEAIKEKLYPTAEYLFRTALEKLDGQWKKINSLTDGVIFLCRNYEELESMEYFRDKLFVLVKAIQDGMVQDEVPEWEKDIAEYIERVENECEQYAYTRKNAWRKSVPDADKYGLNPRYYDTEQEYLKALNDKKYGWRKWYKDRENYGLNPDSFETQEEFRDTLNAKIKEVRQQERAKKAKEYQLAEQAKFREYADDKTIYTYCGVLLPFSSRPYSFRTEDETIQIGDTVIVPVGDDEKEMKGKVVSVGRYSRLGVPYPVEKTKTIIRKTEEE